MGLECLVDQTYYANLKMREIWDNEKIKDDWLFENSKVVMHDELCSRIWGGRKWQ